MIRIFDKRYNPSRYNFYAKNEIRCVDGLPREILTCTITDTHTNTIVENREGKTMMSSTKVFNEVQAITREMDREHKEYMLLLQGYLDPMARLDRFFR